VIRKKLLTTVCFFLEIVVQYYCQVQVCAYSGNEDVKGMKTTCWESLSLSEEKQWEEFNRDRTM
jgi:hypothetical protein